MSIGKLLNTDATPLLLLRARCKSIGVSHHRGARPQKITPFVQPNGFEFREDIVIVPLLKVAGAVYKHTRAHNVQEDGVG